MEITFIWVNVAIQCYTYFSNGTISTLYVLHMTNIRNKYVSNDTPSDNKLIDGGTIGKTVLFM